MSDKRWTLDPWIVPKTRTRSRPMRQSVQTVQITRTTTTSEEPTNGLFDVFKQISMAHIRRRRKRSTIDWNFKDISVSSDDSTELQENQMTSTPQTVRKSVRKSLNPLPYLMNHTVLDSSPYASPFTPKTVIKKRQSRADRTVFGDNISFKSTTTQTNDSLQRIAEEVDDVFVEEKAVNNQVLQTDDESDVSDNEIPDNDEDIENDGEETDEEIEEIANQISFKNHNINSEVESVTEDEDLFNQIQDKDQDINSDVESLTEDEVEDIDNQIQNKDQDINSDVESFTEDEVEEIDNQNQNNDQDINSEVESVTEDEDIEKQIQSKDQNIINVVESVIEDDVDDNQISDMDQDINSEVESVTEDEDIEKQIQNKDQDINSDVESVTEDEDIEKQIQNKDQDINSDVESVTEDEAEDVNQIQNEDQDINRIESVIEDDVDDNDNQISDMDQDINSVVENVAEDTDDKVENDFDNEDMAEDQMTKELSVKMAECKQLLEVEEKTTEVITKAVTTIEVAEEEVSDSSTATMGKENNDSMATDGQAIESADKGYKTTDKVVAAITCEAEEMDCEEMSTPEEYEDQVHDIEDQQIEEEVQPTKAKVKRTKKQIQRTESIDSENIVTQRRSKRNRQHVLEFWRGERPIYRRDSSGVTEKIVAIAEGSQDVLKERKKRAIKRKAEWNDKRINVFELSLHKKVKTNTEKNSLIKSLEDLVWKESGQSKGVEIAITNKNRAKGDAIGMLRFKPFAEKKKSKTGNYATHLTVIYGALSLRIEDNVEDVIRPGMVFKVNPNTNYSLSNLRKDIAILSFTVLKE